MKKMFVFAAMFAAVAMVACCGQQKGTEEKACCDQKTECCEEKAECKGECDKAECKGECDKAECKGECQKAEGECCGGQCQEAEAPAEVAPEA